MYIYIYIYIYVYMWRWALTFIPIPMPKTVCRTMVYDKIVQLKVCITFSGRGMGLNTTAQERLEARG